MSGFVQALRAYREGAMSRESLLTELERQLSGHQVDAVSLLKQLNEEHARSRLPDNLHSAIAARILHWRDPHTALAALSSNSQHNMRGTPHDGTETVVIEREAGSDAKDSPDEASDAEVHRPEPGRPMGHPITLGGVLQGRFKLLEPL